MKNLKVTQLQGNNGAVKNQFEIQTKDGIYFQSYNSLIVFKPVKGKIKLDRQYWDYSVTTSKYRNLFLGENKKATERKIKEGVYVLADLNKNN